MKKLNKIFPLIILCTVSLFGSFNVNADPSIDESIADTTEERDKNQSTLDDINASIDELSEEAGSVEDEIDEVESALVQVLAEIEVIEQDLADKELEIEQAEADYAAAVEKERNQYEAMKIRIQYLYECGNTDILTIYFETGNITETLTKADYIEDLYAYDRKMLAQYQETVQTVNDLHEKLLAEQEELMELQAEYEEEQANMEEVMAELKLVADDYYSRIASARAEAKEYSDKIKEQNTEIARLQEEKKKAEEEEKRKAEEEAKRKEEEEEARRKAQEQMETAESTGVVTTTNNTNYDVSSIYTASGTDLGKAIASFACQFIGNPYVPGGTSLTNGADCSGFVYSVYKNFGYTVPRTSYSLRSAGTEVAYSEAQPGDVICYPGHVAIYIGNGMIVHASTQKTGIKVSKAEYRSILCVRRLI